MGLPLDERDIFARGVLEDGIARIMRIRGDVVEHLPLRAAEDGAVEDGRTERREFELERIGGRGRIGKRPEDGRRRHRRTVGHALSRVCPAAEGIEHGRITVGMNFGKIVKLKKVGR